MLEGVEWDEWEKLLFLDDRYGTKNTFKRSIAHYIVLMELDNTPSCSLHRYSLGYLHRFDK